MDFGIAKMASSSKTQTDVVLGTPTYMSPEQIAGKKVDGRSDVFSLGVVLFELLTGQPPFTADNLSALLFAIAHHPHPDLHTLRQDLPPMFQEIINRPAEGTASAVSTGRRVGAGPPGLSANSRGIRRTRGGGRAAFRKIRRWTQAPAERGLFPCRSCARPLCGV
jgi:serine/threonine protein kinase